MSKSQSAIKKRFFSEADEMHPFYYTNLLGIKPSGINDLIRKVELGFSYKKLETFQKYLGLPTEDLASLVHITTRTLARRRDAGRLESDESDRLLRASRILGKTISLFEGDIDSAKDWLRKPVLALGNKTPLEVCSTEVGALEVEKLIGRLEHGV